MKKFSDLRAKMSPESQAEAHAMAEKMLAELPIVGIDLPDTTPVPENAT